MPITGKATKYSGELSSVYAAEHLILPESLAQSEKVSL